MSKMKYWKLFTTTLTLGFLLTSPALAKDSYQYRVSGSWHNIDSDNSDMDAYFLSGEMYFSPVSTKDHPLAEAYFIERIGSVGIGTNKWEAEFNSSGSSGDGQSFGINVLYVQSDLPYLFQAGYNTSDSEYDAQPSSEISADMYYVGAGYYIMDNFLAGINYQQIDSEDNTGGSDLTDKRYSVYGKQVRELQNNNAYNILINFDIFEDESPTQTYDDWELGLSGDYYLTNLISIGAGLRIHRGDRESAEGNEYTLNNKTFFNQNVGVELSYSIFEADNSSGQDSNYIRFGVIGLF